MSPMSMFMAGVVALMVWVLRPSTKPSSKKADLRSSPNGGISINIYQGHGQSGSTIRRSGSSYTIKSDDD